MRRILVVTACAVATARSVAAQDVWQRSVSGSTSSLRGLQIVNDQVIWASGTRGTVIHSTDGGNTWTADTIPGARAFDIRGVAARSDKVALAVATAGRIWRTLDGGRTWSLRYQASDTTVFLDAIGFWDDRRGMVLGDPMGGRFFILVTADGGDSWQEAPVASRPVALEGEAAFAASGTSLVLLPGGAALIASGGKFARVHRSTDGGMSWTATDVPIQAGNGANGIFSIATSASLEVAVGGDYRKPDSSRAAAARSPDGGQTWVPARVMPSGYRSGVAITRRGLALAVGPNGSDVSFDGGMTWAVLDRSSFNAVQIAPGGMAFAAGASGAIARLDTRRLSSKR
jgi:photosystem II stability/assembly factor-like uncharacterized protein